MAFGILLPFHTISFPKQEMIREHDLFNSLNIKEFINDGNECCVCGFFWSIYLYILFELNLAGERLSVFSHCDRLHNTYSTKYSINNISRWMAVKRKKWQKRMFTRLGYDLKRRHNSKRLEVTMIKFSFYDISQI